MNPKEVSYSHPQLPLCDTPILTQIRPFTGIETQKYGFFGKLQTAGPKNFFCSCGLGWLFGGRAAILVVPYPSFKLHLH